MIFIWVNNILFYELTLTAIFVTETKLLLSLMSYRYLWLHGFGASQGAYSHR